MSPAPIASARPLRSPRPADGRERVTRRRFGQAVAAAAGLAAVGPGACQVLLGAEEPAGRLRVIAYNIYEGTGWPKDRERGKTATAKGQMPARIAAELALYEPDVVAYSESAPEPFMKEVAERLGMTLVTFPSGGKWPGTLMSRHPLIDARNVPLTSGTRPADLFTRHWGRAIVKTPGEDVAVHSIHLMPGDDPAVRLREIPAVLASVAADRAAGRSVLVIGDANHAADGPEYRLWIDGGLTDTFAAVGRGSDLTFTSDTPYIRLDYVFAAGPIAGRAVAARPLFEGAFRVNEADPVSFALSDHLPQYAEFRPAR